MSEISSDEWFRLQTQPLQQRYRVRVHGSEFALPHLVALFPDSDPRVVGERGDFWLNWSGWRPGLTLSEVVEKGYQLLARLRGAARLCGLSTGPLYVWYLILLDTEGREVRQLYPNQQISLEMHSTSNERSRLASWAISHAESDRQIASALEIMGEENDWASIRKTIEAMAATTDGNKGKLANLATLIKYDSTELGKLFGAASSSVHGYVRTQGDPASQLSLGHAEIRLRRIVENWLRAKNIAPQDE